MTSQPTDPTAELRNRWPELLVSDLLLQPQKNGLTRPKAVRGAGTKMVNMGELFAFDRINNCPMDRVPLSDNEQHFLLRPGDLLFARQSLVLEGAGRCVLFQGDEEDATFESHIIRVRLDPARAHSPFYYYWFRSPEGRDRIRSIVTQVAAAGIRGSDLSRLAIPAPPLPTQIAISSILGALDDKIDLNRRMNETLEELARTIFKSWFVDFDPVRAKAEGRQPVGMDAETAGLFPSRLVDSQLGGIPDGWQASTLGEAIEIHDSRRIPLSGREREQRRGPYPYYGAASGMDSVDDYLFDGLYILVGEDGSVVDGSGHPVVQYVWGKFWVNNHAHVLTGRNGLGQEQLLLFLRQCNIAPFVTGAVQPKLSQGNLKAVPFVAAPSEVSEAFGELVSPLYLKLRANADESSTLSSLRDLLLPKLISGELRIKDAEKLAEAVL